MHWPMELILFIIHDLGKKKKIIYWLPHCFQFHIKKVAFEGYCNWDAHSFINIMRNNEWTGDKESSSEFKTISKLIEYRLLRLNLPNKWSLLFPANSQYFRLFR